MFRYRFTIIFIIILFGFSTFAFPQPRATASTPTATFGYTIEKLESPTYWKDISTSGTKVPLSDSDDGVSAPILLPFTFKYFEHASTSFIVCSNGFISLDPAFSDCAFANEHIPLDVQPNDIIAVFWDDLIVGESNNGKVLVKNDGSAPNRYVVVEWFEVTRLGSDDLLTFQIVLYENGGIDLNYKVVNGDATQNTVGIEDRDGVDGIEAVYRGSGFSGSIVPNLTLRFTYPIDLYRVKAMPIFQSSFIQVNPDSRFAEFPLTVVNTDSSRSDSYNISSVPQSGEDWPVVFMDPGTGNAITNTGTIPPGGSKNIIVRMSEPSGTPDVGHFSNQYIVMTSTGDDRKSCRVTIQGAISSSFIQMFSDYEERINLDVVTQSDHFAKFASNSYDYAKSLAVAQIFPNDFWYITAWRQADSIQYIRTHALSGLPPVASQLTNNLNTNPETRDSDPAIDVAQSSNAISGIIFIRDVVDFIDGKWKDKYNVLLSRLSKDGTILANPINLTQNNLWWDGLTSGIPYYYEPRIASVENRFILSWVTNYVDASINSYSNIMVSAYYENGTPVNNPTYYTLISSEPTISYYSPQIARFDNDHVFLTFFSYEPNADFNKYKLWLVILDGDGRNPTVPKRIAYTNGDALDMVKIGNTMFMAWSNNLTDRISYVFLDSDGNPQAPVADMASPDGRRMDTVSVTYAYPPDNLSPAAILTWENPQADRLYYAMIDINGSVTPPMIYRHAYGDLPVVHSGAAGASIAPLPYPLRWYINLPYVRK